LAVAEFVDETSFGLLRVDLEILVKGRIGRLNAQIAAQHDHRVMDRAHDRLGVVASLSDARLRSFELRYINETRDRAGDAVVARETRPLIPITSAHCLSL
jgi:hypothetical protein